MEIGPVNAVRIAPAPPSRDSGRELPGIFEIEYSSRTGDETYSPAATKAASGSEEEEGDELDEELEEAQPRTRAIEFAQRRQVSYFA